MPDLGNPQRYKTTISHEVIRHWAEERQGHPAANRQNGNLAINFGEVRPNLEQLSWEEFFLSLEDNNLAFQYQDRVDGQLSKFCRFVPRESVAIGEGEGERNAAAGAGTDREELDLEAEEAEELYDYLDGQEEDQEFMESEQGAGESSE